MNEDKWEVIKSKFERTLDSWELDKKTNQFTLDSIHSLFPTEIEVIINYIEELQNNWNELKKFVEERIKSVQEEKEEFEEDLYNNYETNRAEIIIRRCELTQLEDVQEQMQELEGNDDGSRDV